ncbi:MAG: sensor histidine kinase, partial [Pseudobdellovibrionaceae bacterium]
SSMSKPVLIEKNMVDRAQILGHRDKLKQAFLNIVINSMQAMSDKENPKLLVRTSIDGDNIQVRVKDSGIGMSAETRKRMFEPFHTTKQKGTGLGLAITHKILEAHSAQIFVESEQGLGTEFVISFPAKNI